MSGPEFGVFARVFAAGPAERVADDIRSAGYTLAQLNLSAVGLPTIPAPDWWEGIDTAAIRAAFDTRGIGLWGLSCSYNMAHPDAAVRRTGTDAAIALIARAPELGVAAVTLCTGTRDVESMWAAHPDNGASEAWRDLRAELDLLLAAAEDAGVQLGVEPEPGNVIRDADAAARLLDELGPDANRIAIIADAANLLHEHADPASHAAVLTNAFQTLAPAIGALHAKDLVPWTESLAGRGVVDYAFVGRLWRALPTTPPVIVQDARPEDAAAVRRLVAAAFAEAHAEQF